MEKECSNDIQYLNIFLRYISRQIMFAQAEYNNKLIIAESINIFEAILKKRYRYFPQIN